MSKFQVKIPNSLDELCESLNETTPRSKILAGGTDLIISLHEKKIDPDLIIDLSGVKELNYIKLENDLISIGATTTFTEINNNQMIQENIVCLAEAAGLVGSSQIRNRATIGGNIAYASPAGDSLPVLMMLGAKIGVMNRSGQVMEYFVDDLLEGARKTILNYNDVIVNIKIPVPKPGFQNGFIKLGTRSRVTIALINIALGIDFDDQAAKINEARIVLGAVNEKPLRVFEAEALLENRTVDEDLLKAVSQKLSELIEKTHRPSSLTWGYKKEAVKGIFCDLMNRLLT